MSQVFSATLQFILLLGIIFSIVFFRKTHKLTIVSTLTVLLILFVFGIVIEILTFNAKNLILKEELQQLLVYLTNSQLLARITIVAAFMSRITLGFLRIYFAAYFD